MATTFKNAVLAPSGTSGTLYTCPAGKTAIVQMVQASSKTQTYTITMSFVDASASTTTDLLTPIAIPYGGSLGLFAGNFVLESGDSLVFSSSIANEMVVFASIAEMS